MTTDEKERVKKDLLNERLIFEDRDPFTIRTITEVDSSEEIEGLGEPPYLLCVAAPNRRWVMSFTQAAELLYSGAYEAFFHEDGEEKSYYVRLKSKDNDNR